MIGKKLVGIIQARMGSKRLPGKVLMEVDGRTMLSYLVERVSKSQKLNDLIVATSTRPENDAIQQECVKLGVGCFRGDEDDVLNRFFQASQWIKADVVVRITGDDVFMDPEVIDYSIECCLSQDCDCATSFTTHSFPGGFVLSIFSHDALDKANKLQLTEFEREHVIPAFISHPDIFKIVGITAPPRWQGYNLSIALDTFKDYTLISEIVRKLLKQKKDFGLEDILAFLKLNPRYYEYALSPGY
jgi:spore coat polysaccharide biosynthesis protein SpsF